MFAHWNYMNKLKREIGMLKSTLWSCVVVLVLAGVAQGQTFKSKSYGVSVTSNIIYDGTNSLTLDIYEPTGAGVPALKPGMVLAHGGAWALGSKDSSTFSGGGLFNTPMHEYAAEFAKRGYVCVSINYRKLTDGGFTFTPTGTLTGAGLDFTGSASLINALLATSFTDGQVTAVFEQATDDTVTAIQWMVTNSATYGIDPSRIAVGGYSSGAFNSLWAAHVVGAPVAAVWTNSGNMFGNGNEALALSTSTVPTISFQGDADTVVVPGGASLALKNALISEGFPHEYYTMSGATHYYLRTNSVPETPVRGVPAPLLEDLVSDFMYAQMNLSGLAPGAPAQSNRGLVILVVSIVGLAGLWMYRRREA
jgi:alpha/beta superfamily hydrolase